MERIFEIIERKLAGINPSEKECVEIIDWLKELRVVGDQKIVAEIQTLFPMVYRDFLNECIEKDEYDDMYPDSN